jgi:hypothetical protein
MYDVRRAELRMTQVALDEIQQMDRQRGAPEAVLRELREEYEGRARDVAAAVEALRLDRDDLRVEESLRARRQVLLAEKESVLADFHRGTITAETYDRLLGAVDARLAKIATGTPLRDGETESGLLPT